MQEHTPADDAVARSKIPELDKRPRWWLFAILTIAAIGAIALLTNVALAQGWIDSVVGPLYTDSEHEAALEDARLAGFSDGEDVGYSEGIEIGRSEGEQTGFETGYEAGERLGFSEGLDAGYEDGLSDGYDSGYTDGYETGQADGSFQSYLDGWTDGCLFLFNGLGTDRVGDWWDYYYSPSYASYYNKSACD
ncbi:MAG: hypothetical protein R3324_00650 [Halobacteriales archaeon]|nr:hypothetical protein [Halobacteriales archaeon]